MMKKITLLVLIILLFLIACSKSEPTRVVIMTGTATKEIKKPIVDTVKEFEKSTVFFGITDSALNLENITSVLISVDSIKLHNNNGWKNFTSEQKLFDLYKLKGLNLSEFFALVNIEKGLYDQVSISFSNPVIFKNGVAETAFITGNSLTFSIDLKLLKNNYVILFDFILDESLHQTVDGKLVFAPTVKLLVNTADRVDLSSDRILRVTNPKTILSNKLGIDEKGRTVPSVPIWHSTKLIIDEGKLRIV